MADYFFTVVTFLAILLCIIPGIFHIQTRNWGAILMIFWVVTTNTILFINSILWATDLDDKAPIYCLISSPIYVGSNFGLLASISCMIHTLYTLIARPMIITENIKRRQAIIDFSLIILVPMILTGCFYLVQTNKYGIRPVLGCFSPAYVNGLFFLIDGIWPVFISIVGCYYAVPRFPYGLSVFDYAKPLTGFFVFLFFGTGRDASSAYIRWAKKIHLDKVFSFLKESYDDLRSQHSKSSKSSKSSQNSTLQSNSHVSSIPDSPFKSPKHVPHLSDSFGDEKDDKSTITTSVSATIPKPKKGLGNIFFLSSHRTPSEQAQIDMTSGIHIRIDGLTTNIIEEDNDHSIEEPVPIYQTVDVFPRGIHEALDEYDDMRLDKQNDTSTFGPLSRSTSVKSTSTIYEYNNSLKPKTVQHTNIQPAYVDAASLVHIEDGYV
ncbi:10171_t:CDS:2 [Dentiscutata heterogama]|uniref:10171_t:CDS:1 n=1 Tax=Dentiscutata heterogama TaxID=1316150 RepID=A0ACA9L0D5_9GLOM|nr:10171_t:CDS:2 [Dentiscutata heterogama]